MCRRTNADCPVIFHLNLHRAVPKRMAFYVNINRYGKEMGLQMSDLPDVQKLRACLKII